ncbi:MAG: fatty acid desaturase [Patescibacteria group bacterium]
MSKFKLNKISLLFVLIIFLSNWYCLLNYTPKLSSILNLIVNVVCLHYMFTTVHQASHGLLSKNSKLNYAYGFLACLFSGITFADFKYTHDLHHIHIGNAEQDPDHKISGSGPVMLIPFKIFYHDWYFLTKCKVKNELVSYFLQRILQISLVVVLFLDKSFLFSTFWLVPMLIIGFMNGLFLFYFPHYQHWIEKTKFNIYPLKKSIQLSRDYHHLHHDNPAKNSSFYPFETTVLAAFGIKYIDSYSPTRDYFYK